MVGHRIDREITAFQVFCQFRGKGYFLGMSRVFVFTVDPVGRHFVAGELSVSFLHHRHRAMLQAGIHRMRKDPLHLFRPRRCSDIPVCRCLSQQTVPHASAYDKGFVSCLIQFYQYIPRILRQHLRCDVT